MVQDIDILRTAKIVINVHGDRALLDAMSRIEEYRLSGDYEGMAVWTRIADAIEWLLLPPGSRGVTCH